MKHILDSSLIIRSSITVLEFDGNSVNIIIENMDNSETIALNKKDLHSLIGTLLHVQAKMKGVNND